MIINITTGKGTQPSVQPGDEIQSQNRIRTEDMLSTLSETNKNAAELTDNLLVISNKVIEGKGTIGYLLNDTIMSKDLKESIRNLKTTSKGVSETVTNINKLITSLDNKDNVIGVINDTAVANKIRNMATNLDLSSTELNKVITNLNATILNIKDGKGTINYLANDPKLVQKIDSTMTNINSASIKLNEDLEALKHNFLFRGYFRKLEREKAKAANKK